ncbi:MAG: hypothetical protein U9N56_09925 [Actinomycetota bacterium]|nr:hypothetical protein [Actinomycetota bacterium]
MGKRAGLILALILVVAACTDSQTGTDTTPVSVTELVESDGGRLVVLDDTGNVVVMAPDGSERIALTDDGGDGVAYSQPIWSPAGDQIVFGEATPEGFGVQIQGADGSGAVDVPMSGLPFYTFWSPTGETIGALHNGSDGLDFEMIDVASETATVVATGSPFYFSWDPAGATVITHVGENRFETLDPVGAKAKFGETDAGYLAPQWTPGGVVHVTGGDLVIQGVGDEPAAIVEVAGFTPFVVNPQGTRVALQTFGDDGALSVALKEVVSVSSDRLLVVDVETGDVEVVDPRPAISFFWSPNGESLLFLTPTEALDGLEVGVWSTAGAVESHGIFNPSPAVLTGLIPFFPQYAQSMSFWAPDSSAFALPGDIEGEEGIWVFGLDGGEPRLVAEGSWVSWSR